MNEWLIKTVVWSVLFATIRSDDTQNAVLNIQTNTSNILVISSMNVDCHNCKHIQLAQFNNLKNLSLTFTTFRPSYYFFIQDRHSSKGYCHDYFAVPFQFGECGTYTLQILEKLNGTFECSISVVIEPESIYVPIYIAIGVFVGASLIYIVLKKLYKKYYHVFSAQNANRSIIDSDFGTLLDNGASTNSVEQEASSRSSVKVKSGRMKSVDAFRGLCLCIMIFANYGAGGYSFLVS